MIEKRFGETEVSVEDVIKKVNLSLEDFDFSHNRSYYGQKEAHGRGGFPYFLPGSGWRRIGLNVKGKYKDIPPIDNNWLGASANNSWAVAYHGLRYENPDPAL